MMRRSIGLEKRMKSRLAIRLKFEAVIDQAVHGIASLSLEKGEGRENQRPALSPARLRRGDQAGMDRLFAEQRFEVADIFGNDHQVLGDAGVPDRVIELAAASDMQRTSGVMAKFGKLERKCRRQTVVDEETHVSGRGAHNARRAAGEGMRLGEQQRRLEGFSREIGVFRGDLVQSVAMGDARFDRIHGQTRASDDGKAALNAGDAFDPGVAGAQITIGALQSVAGELADIGRDGRRQFDLRRFEARKVERS